MVPRRRGRLCALKVVGIAQYTCESKHIVLECKRKDGVLHGEHNGGLRPQLKESAESVFAQLGVSPSSAIQMFYRQVVLQRGLPFDVKLREKVPTAIGGMTRAELDVELQKGMDSMKNGRTYTADEVDAMLARNENI